MIVIRLGGWRLKSGAVQLLLAAVNGSRRDCPGSLPFIQDHPPSSRPSPTPATYMKLNQTGTMASPPEENGAPGENLCRNTGALL